MSEEQRDNIVPTLIEDEMKSSYLDFAMSVNLSRAIPDVRDGFKPSQRRILVAMRDLNLTPGRPTRKCAKIVGQTIGDYHPHGDLAVYDTLARMAQDFSMRYPMVFGQGNFGSIDGDPPGAMRYTLLLNEAGGILGGLPAFRAQRHDRVSLVADLVRA